MDIQTIKEALGLSEEAADVQVLERIQELRSSAGEAFESEPPELVLIRKGEHEQCCLNPDGTVTVTLLEPIPFGKDSISEITLRRPKLKDLRRAEEISKGERLARMAAMIQLLSHPNQAPKIIDELDSMDANVLGLVSAFLSERRRQTGA